MSQNARGNASSQSCDDGGGAPVVDGQVGGSSIADGQKREYQVPHSDGDANQELTSETAEDKPKADSGAQQATTGSGSCKPSNALSFIKDPNTTEAADRGGPDKQKGGKTFLFTTDPDVGPKLTISEMPSSDTVPTKQDPASSIAANEKDQQDASRNAGAGSIKPGGSFFGAEPTDLSALKTQAMKISMIKEVSSQPKRQHSGSERKNEQ